MDTSKKSENADTLDDEHVSLVRIPRKWYYVFVWTFSVLVVGHTLTDVFFGLALHGLGETVLLRLVNLMMLIVGCFFILSHILEGIMLGYAKLFREKVYAEGKAAGIAEGKAAGIAEGKAAGEVDGFQKANQAWIEWFKRKEAAEAAGESFDEPSPAEQHENRTKR